MTVRVVTDSTADLPPDLAAEHGITVVPLNLHFGQETYLDGIDITPDEFYQRLTSSPQLPTTSQPSVGAFMEVYEGLREGAEGIVSVHISAKLSGTCNSANQAKAELSETVAIEIVDTQLASLGVGLAALAAARAAQAGAGLAEVAAEARRAADETRVLFMVDTLEYLQKGGRIGKAAAFFGGLLNVKPLLTIHEGQVHPLERARTRSKAMDRLEQMLQAEAPIQQLAVMCTTTPDDANAVAQRNAWLVAPEQPIIGRLGAVVGTYAGPGLLGVALRKAR